MHRATFPTTTINWEDITVKECINLTDITTVGQEASICGCVLDDPGDSVMLMRPSSLMARTKLGIENRIEQKHTHTRLHKTFEMCVYGNGRSFGGHTDGQGRF